MARERLGSTFVPLLVGLREQPILRIHEAPRVHDWIRVLPLEVG